MNPIQWPGGAKCAAMITVNLDAEYFWLSLDPSCHNRPKTLSMGQYGMTRGLDRLLDVLERYGIQATFFVPGKVAELYSDDMKKILEKGHEIGVHGYAHENFGLLSEAEQQETMEKSVQAVAEVCGEAPIGFRAPEGELTLKTLEFAYRCGIRYSSTLSNDDRPYWLPVNDQGDALLEIPIQWALYDLPYFAFNYRPAFPAGQGRVANYSQVLDNWKDEFTGHYDRGLCYVLQLDPQTIGTPGRIHLVEELLDHIRGLGDTWFATGRQMLEFCQRQK